MKKLTIATILALSASKTLSSDIAYIDCYSLPEKEDAKKFLFLELDWDKSSGKSDASYFISDGSSIGKYSNIKVSESPKQISYQSPINVLKDQPTQYVEVIISRVNLNFSAGITTPLWKQAMGGNMIELQGECAINNKRAPEQVF